jgi:5-methylthioadenosine/S-adenosylhomocysteine deaminase
MRGILGETIVDFPAPDHRTAVQAFVRIGLLGPDAVGAHCIWVDSADIAAHAAPMYNVYSQLVCALKGSDVKTVIIDGKLVMEDRHLLPLNEKEIVAQAHRYQKKISALRSVQVMSEPARFL